MKRFDALFGVVRVPVDALAVSAALLLSYRLRQARIDLLPGVQLLEPARSLPSLHNYVSGFVLPGTAVFILIAAVMGLYLFRSTRSAWAEMGAILAAAAVWLVVIVGWYTLVLQQLFYSRAILASSVALLVVFVAVGRSALLLLQRSLLSLGAGRVVTVSVGAQPLVDIARRMLEGDARYHYVGHLEDLVALELVIEERDVDLVLQTDPHPSGEVTIRLIDTCRSRHIGYGFLPPVLADVPHMLQVERIGILPVMRFQPTPLDGWGSVAKRLFDLLVSAILLLLLSPVLLLLSVLILLTMGWPILYVSTRVGQRGTQTVPVLKFRTMVQDADRRKAELLALNHRQDGPLFKVRDDPRVTPLGRVLRRLSLDELPQLLNVFLGHLSLVGPRPHLPEEVARYTPEQRRVFAVKPGMTGLPQVSGRSDLTFAEEVRLDLQYVEEWSIWLDLWILWRTAWVVAVRKGAD